MKNKFKTVNKQQISIVINSLGNPIRCADKQQMRNTCICTITRDELRNPAGGIIDYVESTAPYVGALAVLDTFSIDGTWIALNELKKRHPNLYLSRRPFLGFDHARNLSINLGKKSQQKYFFTMDADERLFPENFSKLGAILEENVDFCQVNFTHMDENSSEGGQSCRLSAIVPFYLNPRFERSFGEELQFDRLVQKPIYESGVTIKHFQPSEYKSWQQKRDHYYDLLIKLRDSNLLASRLIMPFMCPSLFHGFYGWKTINRQRKTMSELRELTTAEIGLFYNE
jgi:glycosyltransferase involved in cell wall biosynthesis